MLRETECDGASLYKAASSMLSDPEKLQSMGRAVQELAVPDSAQRILQIITELAGSK